MKTKQLKFKIIEDMEKEDLKQGLKSLIPRFAIFGAVMVPYVAAMNYIAKNPQYCEAIETFLKSPIFK